MKLRASQPSAYERGSSRRVSYQPGYVFVSGAGKIALNMKRLHQVNVLAKSSIPMIIRNYSFHLYSNRTIELGLLFEVKQGKSPQDKQGENSSMFQQCVAAGVAVLG